MRSASATRRLISKSVSLCLSLCLPLYRCTCFLSALVRWAKPSCSLALASVCICGAQDASCSLPVAALILHVRLISQTVKIWQSECGCTISNLRYKLNMCNALYILWAGDNTIVGSYQTLRLCKRNGVQNSLINVNSLSLSLTQGWAQRGSTGWVEIRPRWKACNGSLTRVSHMTCLPFTFFFFWSLFSVSV